MNLNADSREHSVKYIKVKNQDTLEEIKQLFLEYAGSLAIDLGFQKFEDELMNLPEGYGSPDGCLVLALVDGKGAGCVGLRKIAEGVCEMKRLYVRSAYRKLGIGKGLLNMVIEDAKKLGYTYIRLDTLQTMEKAQSLYKSFGFYEIEPYVYNPIEGTKFLELDLRSVGARNLNNTRQFI